MTSKIICFLDVDGVLTSPRVTVGVHEKGLMKRFDPIACEFLQHHCKNSGMEIVISSYWRMGTTANYWRDLFHCAGYKDINVYRDDRAFRTAELPGKRGDEIAHWIKTYGQHDYIILDDDGDMLDEQREFFVQTSVNEGMCLQNYARFNLIIAEFRQDDDEADKWRSIYMDVMGTKPVIESQGGRGNL